MSIGKLYREMQAFVYHVQLFAIFQCSDILIYAKSRAVISLSAMVIMYCPAKDFNTAVISLHESANHYEMLKHKYIKYTAPLITCFPL